MNPKAEAGCYELWAEQLIVKSNLLSGGMRGPDRLTRIAQERYDLANKRRTCCFVDKAGLYVGQFAG